MQDTSPHSNARGARAHASVWVPFYFSGWCYIIVFFFFFFFFMLKTIRKLSVFFFFLKSYQPSSTYSCHSTRPAISGLEMGQLEKGEWGKFPTGEAIYSLIREGNRHFFPLKTEKKIKPDTAQPWLSWRWSMRSSRCCFLGTGFICSHAALLQIDFETLAIIVLAFAWTDTLGFSSKTLGHWLLEIT